jgi:hypothetical protein
MQYIDENIDLDALFDVLNIGESKPAKPEGAAKAAASSQPEVKTADIQQLLSLDGDLFLFDSPTDQS